MSVFLFFLSYSVGFVHILYAALYGRMRPVWLYCIFHIKCVLIFLTTYLWYICHYNNNSVSRYKRK